MNRENKLALIIGFTLILVVGVLVSDHLSRANSAQLGQGPGASETERHLPISGGIIQETIAANVSPRTIPQTRAQADPVLDSIGSKPVPASDNRFAITDPNPVVIDQSPRGVELGNPVQASRAGSNTFRKILDIYQSSAIPAAVELSGAGPSGVITEPNIPIPTSITHEVEPKENLFRIAAKYLGDGERWREIRDTNPGLVGRDGEIGVGAKLKITVLEPVVASNRPRINDSSRSIDINEPLTRSYTVKKNEFLSNISQRELGTIHRMDEIMKLNNLDDADSIWAGMTLKLPTN